MTQNWIANIMVGEKKFNFRYLITSPEDCAQQEQVGANPWNYCMTTAELSHIHLLHRTTIEEFASKTRLAKKSIGRSTVAAILMVGCWDGSR